MHYYWNDFWLNLLSFIYNSMKSRIVFVSCHYLLIKYILCWVGISCLGLNGRTSSLILHGDGIKIVQKYDRSPQGRQGIQGHDVQDVVLCGRRSQERHGTVWPGRRAFQDKQWVHWQADKGLDGIWDELTLWYRKFLRGQWK